MKARITRKLLEKLGACSDALGTFAPLLPITLDTDPERNVNEALRILESPVMWGSVMWGSAYPVYWMLLFGAYDVATHEAAVHDALADYEDVDTHAAPYYRDHLNHLNFSQMIQNMAAIAHHLIRRKLVRPVTR